MEPAALSDEELIEQYRAGSPGHREPWISELFRRHHGRVSYWCLRLTGDRESAADLAQEIFLKAYQNLHSFRGGSKFSTWLFSITRNHCWNEMRSRSTRPDQNVEPLIEEITDSGWGDPHATLERESTMHVMRELINELLDETEKRVVMLHYVEGLPLESVTRLLELDNASGAKAYIVSARRKLSRAAERLRARAPKVAS